MSAGALAVGPFASGRTGRIDTIKVGLIGCGGRGSGAATQALRESNPVEFGILMDVSHDSLDEDYEVTCPELNLLVGLARDCKGVYGSRMTGGGFGGCTVSLVRSEAVDAVTGITTEKYSRQTGIAPTVFASRPAAGARIVKGAQVS